MCNEREDEAGAVLDRLRLLEGLAVALYALETAAVQAAAGIPEVYRREAAPLVDAIILNRGRDSVKALQNLCKKARDEIQAKEV